AKGAASGAPVRSIKAYDIATKGAVVDARAEELYYVEQARATLDREIHVQVCLSRDGYIRACFDAGGHPFAADPIPRVDKSVDMRRGIGGVLAGSFVLTQQDGPDCKFSPSPQTTGVLRMSFDNERNTLTGALRTEQRGTRPNLHCSLGTANMLWSQTYNVN